MAKRHTDTGIFDQQWFQQLTPDYKCFWFYICAKCDHAGIWEVNIPLAKFFIRASEIGDNNEILKLFGDRIIDLGNDKWYLTKYVDFHHGGVLNNNNNFHSSIIKSLDRYGLVEQDKDDNYVVKSEPGEKKKVVKQPYSRRKLTRPSLEQVKEYCKERDRDFFFATNEYQKPTVYFDATNEEEWRKVQKLATDEQIKFWDSEGWSMKKVKGKENRFKKKH